MSDQYYARDGESAVWTSAQLRAGVVVAMEARSDQFLLIAPGNNTVEVDAARLIPSREFSVLPCHAESSAQADATAGESAGALGDNPAERIVYTATEPMTEGGYAGVRSIISNAIRTIDLNGENDARLRHLRGHLWSPRVSPDGKKIAFVHYAHGRGQIFVMDADGSNAVNVSNNEFCDRAPVWNPHDGRIAFVSDRTGDWDIYVMNHDGSDQRLLAGNPGLDRAPVWSPDGTQLAWESHTSGSSNIWIRVAGESRPLVAPGRHVKFRMARDWVDPPPIVDLEPIFPDNTSYLWHPVWSPDGKHIAAGTIHHLAGDTPAVLAADGSSVLQLVYAYTGIDHLTWSPDGRWLAGTWRCAPQETERSGVFVIKSDGTDHEKREYWVVDVTPQGPRLGGTARAGLTTWYSHGSARPRRVVKTFTSLAWSPDGKTLAFSSDMDPSGAFYVYTISTEGGQPRRLDRTMSAWPNEIMWMPRNN